MMVDPDPPAQAITIVIPSLSSVRVSIFLLFSRDSCVRSNVRALDSGRSSLVLCLIPGRSSRVDDGGV